MVGKIQNRIWAHRRALGAPLRPPLRPSGPSVCPDAIFNLAHHREKNVQLLSTEVRATQQNPRYSGKNNVAMRMIATFMTKYFASQYCVFFSNQMCIQHPIVYFFLNKVKEIEVPHVLANCHRYDYYYNGVNLCCFSMVQSLINKRYHVF